MQGLLVANEGREAKGTHFLVEDMGGMTPLRSVKLNLSAEEYLGNEVEVAGVLNEEDGVFEVEAIKVINLILTEDEEEEETMTYTNDEWGVSFDYSSRFDISEGGTLRLFSDSGSEVVFAQELYYFEGEGLEDDASFNEEAIKSYFEENYGAGQYKISYLGEQNLPALNVEGTYMLYRNGLIYRIEWLPAEESEDAEEDERAFEELLASLRFVGTVGHGEYDEEEEENEVVMTNYEMTAYESLPYSFRGVYPKSWYYEGRSASESGVLYQYRFGDEVIEDDNQLITLDILTGNTTLSGQKRSVNGKEVYVSYGGQVQVELAENGKAFRFYGDSDYEELIIMMATSLEIGVAN